MTRTKSADHILVAIMIALALYSAHSIFIDKFNTAQNAPILKAGEVLTFKNSVKRKTSQIFSWFDTFKGDSLYNGDSIFTYENSSADVLVFGNKVSLAENTLIKISDVKDQTIDLEKGSVDATTIDGEYLTLSIAGEKVKVGGSQAKIQISKTEEGKRITVKDGKAKVKIGDQTIDVDNKQSINIVKSNAVSQKPLSLNLYPLHKEKIYFTNNKKIEFKFESLEKEPYFEISQNFDFSKSRKFQAKNGNVKLTLNKESSYYWRICNYDLKEDQFCDISQFELIKAKAPNLYLSEDKNQYYINQDIVFNWEHESENYKIFLTRNGSKILEQELTSRKFLYTPQEAGNYVFQIRPIYPQQLDQSIIATTKLIKVIPIPKLAVVNHILPNQDEKLIYYNKDDAKIFFKWDNPQNINQFILRINDKVINTKKPFQTILLEEGRYSWDVTPLLSESITGPTSDSSNFSIEFKKPSSKPEEGTIIELERPGDEVSFEWSGEDQRFLFEVSSDNQFENIIHSETTTNNFSKFSFGEKGTYFWRSKIINSQGKVIYSPPKKVIIQPGTMPEPIQLEEKKKIKIFRKTSHFLLKVLDFFIPSAHASEAQTIRLEWPATKKAKRYIVKVYSDPNGEDEIISKETSFPHLDLEVEELTSLFYKVAIIDHWNRKTKFSNLSEVEIVYEYQSQRPIKLILPKHKSSFETKKKKRISFQWESQKYTENYQIIISKNLNLSNPIIDKKTSTNKILLNLPKGRYYWKIISFDKNGKRINSSKRRLVSFYTPRNKKKSNKKSIVSSTKKVKVSRYHFEKHLPILLYTPSKFSLEQSSSAHNVNIDGTFLNSITFEGRYLSKFNYSLQRSSGEVFSQYGFQILDLSGNYLSPYSQKFISNSFINYGVKAKSLKIFPLSGTSLTELNKTLFGAHLGLSFGNFYKSHYEATLGYVMGNYSGLLGTLKFRFKEKYILGFNYESGSFEEGSSKVDFSNLSLGIGSSF